IILLQLKNLQVGIIFFKIEDILDIGSSEGVDALSIVAHYTDVFVDGGQFTDNQVLRKIGILILIDHEVFKLVLVFMQYIGKLPKQHVRFKQQIIKIHGARFVTTLGIRKVDLSQLSTSIGKIFCLYLFVTGILLCRDQVVLRRGDPVIYKIRIVQLVVQLHLLQDTANKALAIICIVNGKIERIPDMFRFDP